MKTKPSTEYVLIGSLMSGPKHGYEIKQFLNSVLESTWHVSTSQLYALLKRLEKDKLLHSKVELQDSRPSKRIFTLTDKGQKAFLGWLNSPTEHVRDFRIEFIGKLFFFNHLSLKGGPDLIDAQIQVIKRVEGRVRQRREVEKDPFNRLVCGFKIETLENLLTWLSRHAAPFMKRIEGDRS